MKEGLLWFDDDPGRGLVEKVTRAAKRYQQKYGTTPNMCYVHPSMMPSTTGGNGKGARPEIKGMSIAPLPSVLRHHFWVGQEQK